MESRWRRLLATSTLLHLLPVLTEAAQCYSCASSNMQTNFLTKNRGPQRRIREPVVYDNYCNVDVWILRERALVQCVGPCFKWQQILNNSGSYSYMTFRGCYSQMFDLSMSFNPPNHTFCTQSQVALQCLSDASVQESSCWCDGDLCNFSFLPFASLFFLLFSLIRSLS